MTPTKDPADLIGFIAAVVTYFASKEIADVVSPYIGIIIAATMAAGWALSRAGQLTGFQSVKFMLLRVGTAAIFAVTLAKLIHAVAPWAAVSVTMIPIAFLIGLVKDLDELKEYKDGFINWFKGKKDA
jgi:hypothetical protein